MTHTIVFLLVPLALFKQYEYYMTMYQTESEVNATGIRDNTFSYTPEENNFHVMTSNS